MNGKLNQDSNQWWNFLVRCFFNKKKNVTNICFDILNAHSQLSQTVVHSKGGFKSEDTWECLLLQNKHSKSLSWGKKLNKLFTVFGGKFKFSAQNSDLEYLSWRCKNVPVSSDFNPPLVVETFIVKIADIEFLSLW